MTENLKVQLDLSADFLISIPWITITGVAGVAGATPIFWLFQGLNKTNFENQTEIGGYVCCRHPKILDRVPALV